MSAAELASYERELRLRGPPGNTLKCALLIVTLNPSFDFDPALALLPTTAASPLCNVKATP